MILFFHQTHKKYINSTNQTNKKVNFTNSQHLYINFILQISTFTHTKNKILTHKLIQINKHTRQNIQNVRQKWLVQLFQLLNLHLIFLVYLKIPNLYFFQKIHQIIICLIFYTTNQTMCKITRYFFINILYKHANKSFTHKKKLTKLQNTCNNNTTYK